MRGRRTQAAGPDATPSGATTSGATTSGATTSGATTSGATTSGATTSDATTPEAIGPEQLRAAGVSRPEEPAPAPEFRRDEVDLKFGGTADPIFASQTVMTEAFRYIPPHALATAPATAVWRISGPENPADTGAALAGAVEGSTAETAARLSSAASTETRPDWTEGKPLAPPHLLAGGGGGVGGSGVGGGVGGGSDPWPLAAAGARAAEVHDALRAAEVLPDGPPEVGANSRRGAEGAAGQSAPAQENLQRPSPAPPAAGLTEWMGRLPDAALEHGRFTGLQDKQPRPDFAAQPQAPHQAGESLPRAEGGEGQHKFSGANGGAVPNPPGDFRPGGPRAEAVAEHSREPRSERAPAAGGRLPAGNSEAPHSTGPAQPASGSSVGTSPDRGMTEQGRGFPQSPQRDSAGPEAPVIAPGARAQDAPSAGNSTVPVAAVNPTPQGGELTWRPDAASDTAAAAGRVAAPADDSPRFVPPARLELSLHSEELGAITMRAVARREYVSASLAVESHELRGVIHAHLPALEQRLAERQVQVGAISLSDPDGSGQAMSGSGTGTSRQHSEKPPDGASPANWPGGMERPGWGASAGSAPVLGAVSGQRGTGRLSLLV